MTVSAWPYQPIFQTNLEGNCSSTTLSWHEKGEGNKVLNQTVGPEVTYLWLFRGLFFQVSAVFSYLYFLSLFSVTKTNLSVHEDKNRVPYVKVSQGVLC